MYIKEFYNGIKGQGLKALSDARKTKDDLNLITKYFNIGERILDAACGYGRLTVPLAKKKIVIEGIDISHELIKSAKAYSKKERLKIKFREGDMRLLPYPMNSFNGVLCFWTSFSHLLTQKDQIYFLNEQHRVLRKEGTLLIDVVDGNNKAIKQKLQQLGRGKQKRILKSKYMDLIHTEFIHDKASMTSIFEKSKFSIYEVKFWNRNGKRRLLGILKKS